MEIDRSLQDDEIGVVCTDCAYETRKSVGWLRAHTQVECPGCGAIIDVESRNFRKIASRGRASDAGD
ncbi:hypothetical protein RFM26_10600 [Mesorhizobium sp. VK23B]|uniref:Small CPxCG-related zinc finger protein n=1 Tax=Mesorhizobium dulcispinae TaxID=3072316 RepID=A0ABU4XAX1_9HYPH|nr:MULTISPECIES: hypothetical protein [unclassified Mesorhizobium]MDX8466130.1 hypothetical protein [Mesorhizobium sp. VK23B]MDX8471941.1 hypothetical protein [Mesorhizobium sp. VK23A]MDX8517466.1 hypothetical protein [Mesorhizobium sp. VK23D]